MQVNCYNTDCMYLTVFNTCGNNYISLDDEGVCDSFLHYITDKEYQEKYFIAVKTANGKKGKALKHGKKLEIFGYTFFTSDNYKLLGEQSRVTEERTGFLCGSIAQLKAHFEKFKMLESKEPSCSSYPLCEYNENIGKYIPQEEGAGNG